MTFLPIFHPRIETDVREAVAYYNDRSPGLGVRSKRTFYRTVDGLLMFPKMHAVKASEEIRTRMMRPFPYVVFDAVERDIVFVLAVQYAGRRPELLRALAQERYAT